MSEDWLLPDYSLLTYFPSSSILLCVQVLPYSMHTEISEVGSIAAGCSRKVPENFAPSMDVKFSHVGQCDPGDCDAQKEYFEIAPKADQQDAWRYKYLLDMDGNAFSGRFYAFLKSKN